MNNNIKNTTKNNIINKIKNNRHLYLRKIITVRN